MTFNVTDGAKTVGVDCAGACFANVPDLFREGQGVVAEGALAAGGRLSAEAILAKHDERYMPREVVEALKRQGRWQEGAAKP
jgi:cytochrome c-type biogenesis protein CcmE